MNSVFLIFIASFRFSCCKVTLLSCFCQGKYARRAVRWGINLSCCMKFIHSTLPHFQIICVTLHRTTKKLLYGQILAVDDNPAILTALRLCLGGRFEGVIPLSDPGKILSTLEKENVSAVLLDMNFTLGVNTGSDGLFCLRTIRKKFPHIPVVLLTAYGDIALAVKGMKEGAADFVTKPWDYNQLIGILCEAIHRSRQVTPLDELATDYVHKVVEQCGGNISEAAKLLGVTRQTIYTKMKRP